MEYKQNMKPYELIYYPDPRLNQKSEYVEVVDEKIREIMDRLLASIHSHQGIGVSAVQVGIMKRIVVIDIDGVYQDRKDMKPVHGGNPLFMVNPTIVESSTEKASLNEGCMSIPGVYVDIIRPTIVTIEFLDYEGNKQTLTTSKGILSACVQHEIDHTNGILILDYLSPLKRQMQIKKMEKYKKLLSRHQENKNTF